MFNLFQDRRSNVYASSTCVEIYRYIAYTHLCTISFNVCVVYLIVPVSFQLSHSLETETEVLHC